MGWVATKVVGETRQNYLWSNHETEYHCRPVEAGHCDVSWEIKVTSNLVDPTTRALKKSSFQQYWKGRTVGLGSMCLGGLGINE